MEELFGRALDCRNLARKYYRRKQYATSLRICEEALCHALNVLGEIVDDAAELIVKVCHDI